MKFSKNQNYDDIVESYRAESEAAVDKLTVKLGHTCSEQRLDIVLNAIANLLIVEMANCVDADKHQAIIDLLAWSITEGLRRYLAKKMPATMN